MRIIDYFRGKMNPEIVRQFNELLDNDMEAVRLYCQGGYRNPERGKWKPNKEGFPKPDRSISFKWKKKLVEEANTIRNWYLEETEYRKGCTYSHSHPYGLTIALRKLSVMPKDAPTPYLPEWKKIGGDAPFPATGKRLLKSPYRTVPFYLIEGRIYKSVNWQQVEQWETEARELLIRIDHLTKWRKEQTDFAPKCYTLMKEKIPNWGCYYYDVPFPNAENIEHDFVNVRQVFFKDFCPDTKLDYTHFKRCAENKQTVSSFLRMDSTYLKFVQPLLDYILALYSEADAGLTVILGNSMTDGSAELNRYHFQELIKKLEENNIPVVYYDELDTTFKGIPIGKVIVVVEVVTSNEHLKDTCSKLFKKYEEEAPLIVYVSLLKEYSSNEMQSLIEAENKKIEEIEKKKKEEEERRRKAEEEQRRKEEELRTKRMMLGAAESKDWPMVKGVHHYFFYYYYPTRFNDVTEFDWDVRNLIWNFKDGTRHNKVCEILTEKLKRVYGKALDLLTFVCIPASTCVVNRNRYQSFMADVCNATGMANGYDHVTIVKEKEPSHLGGESPAEYDYDKDFFNGRQIILFDDVVTRGRSLARMRLELESAGAHVVAALSIGRTYSDFYGDNREPHPWVVENQTRITLRGS